MTKRNKSLQGIRAIAIAMVFLQHMQVFLGENVTVFDNWGKWGVYIFIALSGVLLANGIQKYNYRGTPKEGLRLALKNAKKLYWLHALLWLIDLLAVAIFTMEAIRIPIYSIFHLTLTQAFVPFIDLNYSFNGSSWYLSMCVFLWLFTPLLVALYKRRPRGKWFHLGWAAGFLSATLAWLGLAKLAVFIIENYIPFAKSIWVEGWLTYVSPPLCFLYFAFAFFFALWLRDIHPTARRVSYYVSWVAIILYFIFTPSLPLPIPGVIKGILVLLFVIVLSELAFGKKTEPIGFVLKLPPLVFIGNISSYLFLIHGVVNYILRQYCLSVGTPWLFLISLAISLALSTGVWALVRWWETRRRRKKATA